MGRYPRRPWFHPLTVLASEPYAYALSLILAGVTLLYPFRYNIAEYFERQMSGYEHEVRLRSILFYYAVAQAHRRQAHFNLPSFMEDDPMVRADAQRAVSSLRLGQGDYETNYWHAHQRDALRAEQLLREINELKERIAEGGDDDGSGDVTTTTQPVA